MKQSARELIKCGIQSVDTRPEDTYAVGSTAQKIQEVQAGATWLVLEFITASLHHQTNLLDRTKKKFNAKFFCQYCPTISCALLGNTVPVIYSANGRVHMM